MKFPTLASRSAHSTRSDPQRELVTPEGLSLPVTLASRGARAGALLLDFSIIFVALFLFMLGMSAIGIGLFDNVDWNRMGPLIELLLVIVILVLFLGRYGYFLFFELGPRGATPGKRLLGIRVAARPASGDGPARLTAEAVLARNLVRDIEIFLPLGMIAGMGEGLGVSGWAATIWLGIFLLFPFFNRDRLRAGDLIAGTWVVETPRAKLADALSVGMSVTPDRRDTYRFGDAELAVYGEHELQVLEQVLRQDRPESLREVAEAISRKIGWEIGTGDDRDFLEAFYAALRAHLERGMRFGRRKRDKNS